MYNVGVNLIETDGRATPNIQGAATSVAGFAILAERGVPGKVRRVTNFTEFREAFGGYYKQYHGAYALKGFFENGGAVAYVTRVCCGAYAAAKVVSSKTNANDGLGPLTITAGYRGEVDPGDWGESLKVDVKLTKDGQNVVAFDLTIKLNGATVESWIALPPTQAGADKVNNEFTGSKYITLAIDPGKTFKGDETLSLATGADSEAPAAADYDDAFHLFDTIDAQLLACPESAAADVIAAGLAYADERKDCVYVTHANNSADDDADKAKLVGAAKRGANVYGAMYFPWIRVLDPQGTSRWVPPTGHIMGVIARTERERGVWKAPAGAATRVAGALDVRHHISDATHTDLVKNAGVNVVRFIAGQGIVIDSARTLSTSPLWQFLNVRLLFNFVKSSLKSGLRWVVYEPNDEVLWNKVRHNAVTPFLMNLWRRGAFGPGSSEDVFSVKCDLENNPPANVANGILNVEVYFYPSRPAETFVLTVGQQEGGPTANEG